MRTLVACALVALSFYHAFANDDKCLARPEIERAIAQLSIATDYQELLGELAQSPHEAVCQLVWGLRTTSVEVLRPGAEQSDAEQDAFRLVWKVRALRYLTNGLDFVSGTRTEWRVDLPEYVGTTPTEIARRNFLTSEGDDRVPYFREWMSRGIVFIAPSDTQQRIIDQWRSWFERQAGAYHFEEAQSLDDWYF